MTENEVITVALHPSGSIDLKMQIVGQENNKKERELYVKNQKDEFQGYPISLNFMGDPVDVLLIDYPERLSLSQEKLKAFFE